MRGRRSSTTGPGFLRVLARRGLVTKTQRAIAVIAATGLAFAGVVTLGASPAFAANDGDGAMTVTPTSVNAGSTGNTLTFTFTNDGSSAFSSNSFVRLTIPAGWTAPQRSNSSNAGYVVVANGSGSCSPDTTPTISGSGPWLIDITQVCNVNNTFTVTYGAGSSSTKVAAPTTAAAHTFTTRSQNGGSGLTDIGPLQPTVTVNPGPASQLAFTTQPSGATAGSIWTSEPVVAVRDSLGNVVTTQNTGTVTMSIAGGSPQATFTSGTATVNVVNGLATFTNLVVNTAGSYTLTATPASISGVSSAVNSSAFTVKPAAANKLVVTAQPAASITAGATVTVGVTIQDTFGNTITTGNTGSTDTLAVSLSTGSFAGGTTSRSAVNGVVSFTGLQINSTAGSPYTIHVTNTSRPSVTATDTAPITVVAATGAKLVITSAPFSATAATGATNGLTAVLQDQFGNLTTSASPITVNLSSTSSGATFAATSGGSSITSVPLPANTSNLGFFYGDTVAGSPTITASGAGLAPNAAQVETITAAAADQLVFVHHPSDTSVGVAMSPPVTVQVKDQFGNSAPTPSGIGVSLAASSGTVDSGANATTNASGLATFGGITINAAAAGLTLTASSSGLTATVPSSAFNVTVPVTNGAALTATASDTGSGVASVSYYYCAGYTGSCTSGTFIGTSTNAAGDFPVTWSSQPADGAYRIVSVGIDNVTNTSSASAPIPVTVSNVDHFIVSAPASTTPGAAFTVTVSAVNAANVVLPGYRGTIHFTSSDPAAGLPTDYTFVAGDNGVHVFSSGVTLNSTGVRSITVNDTAFPAQTGTTNVTVSGVPGAPTNVTVSGNFCLLGSCTVNVNFTAPASNGGSPITQYNASCVSSNGGNTPTPKTGASSPIAVPGAFVGPQYLSDNKTYTCSVTATNANGTGPPGTSGPFSA